MTNLNYSRALESLESNITQINQHQGEALQTHRQYLNNEMEYAKIFLHLLQQQNYLLNNSAHQPTEIRTAIMESLERSMTRLHEHQTETLRVHEQFLNHHTNHNQNFFQMVQQEYHLWTTGSSIYSLTESITTPGTSEVLPEVIGSSISGAVLPDVKTPGTISPGSVTLRSEPPKLEEVIGSSISDAVLPDVKTNGTISPGSVTLRSEPPKLEEVIAPSISGAVLPEVKTNGTISPSSVPLRSEPPKLQEVIAPSISDAVLPEVKAPGAISSSAVPLPIVFDPPPVINNSKQISQESTAIIPSVGAAVEAITSLEIDRFAQTLLEVVSQKTGYPSEMLEMDMDMEADLGIDSIKRLEILGEMQDRFPHLPKLEVANLGEIRTLSQIVEQIEQGVLMVEFEKKNFRDSVVVGNPF